MTGNICFHLKMMLAIQMVLRASVMHCSLTWHKWLGHLNDRSLKLLQKQEIVHGLPQLKESKGICEGCMLGKQHINALATKST